MALSATIITPDAALGALAEAISRAKAHDVLAGVTVAVTTNTAGVMARRALGRTVGIAGVDFVTLNRLAELIAGPSLAAEQRRPVSAPLLELTVAGVLARQPGMFEPVASHPSTIIALRRLHDTLRMAGPAARAALSEHSARGREAVRVSTAIDTALAARWYDEADLYLRAIEVVHDRVPAGLRHLVVHLPDQLPLLARSFLRAIGDHLDVHLIVARSGVDAADASMLDVLDQLDVDDRSGAAASGWPTGIPAPAPATIVSTTDADDEVRHAVRAVVDAARDGVALERIAIVWPSEQPYARLVEHQLTAAGLAWNGRPGTATAEHLAPRLVLDLLDIDRRGLRRRALFELLADVPARDDDGTLLPTARWERVSREAGVVRDDDWEQRLGVLVGRESWAAEPAGELRSFVRGLREQLGQPARSRPWSEWSQWCHEQLDRWLGASTIDHLPEVEYRAWETLVRCLDRLAHLDAIGGPVTRHVFRTTLEAELDAQPGRRGRVGDGVTVGPLAGATGHDVDITIVLGAADGVLPAPPHPDPLLSETDRAVAGLPCADAHMHHVHRMLVAACATSRVTITVPRGDLRATRHLLPSRWLAPWVDSAGSVIERRVASHHAGLAATSFPATAPEHRLRARRAAVRAGTPLADVVGVDADPALRRALALVAARRDDELTTYDGDLSSAGVPPLDVAVSPSRLEAWIACPHAYFVRYLLGVRPVEEPDAAFSISAPDRGSVQHDVLDRFHRAVIAGELPQPGHDGWTEEHRVALITMFDEICERTQRRGRTGRPAYWADERERMRADLLGWLEADSARARARGLSVVASEWRFDASEAAAIELPDGRAITLTGVIDRVDRASDGTLVVTDHKTGRNKWKTLSADDPTVGGTAFQLPSYAAAARQHFGPPDVAVLAEYSMFAAGDYQRPGLGIDAEVAARVAESLAVVVDGIESGWFPLRPSPPVWQPWVPCWYCDPDGLGTADRWNVWERKRHDPRIARWFGDPPDDERSDSSGPLGREGP